MEEFTYMCNEDIIRTITGVKTNKLGTTLTDMANMDIEELTKIKGIGEVTAKKILAAFELGRRMLQENVYRTCLDNSYAIYNYLRPTMSHLDHEETRLLVINNNFELLKDVCLSVGGLTETVVDVRQIVKHAVLSNGTIIVLAHNHPSNNRHPSKNDDKITAQVNKACDVMRIHLLDHLIITDECYYSYRDNNKL